MSDVRTGRDAQVCLRMTQADREEINRRAAAAGQSVQEFAIERLVGRRVKYRPGPAPSSRKQIEELPMTG